MRYDLSNVWPIFGALSQAIGCRDIRGRGCRALKFLHIFAACVFCMYFPEEFPNKRDSKIVLYPAGSKSVTE
jgi:hypothetical protein